MTIDQIDRVLGLNIAGLAKEIVNIPEEILELKSERETARLEKNWARSDELRADIEKEGFILEDLTSSTTIRKKLSSLI